MAAGTVVGLSWADFRRGDSSIDLKKAFAAYYKVMERGDGNLDNPANVGLSWAKDYIERVEALQTIRSRQMAAVVIVTAFKQRFA